MITMNVKKIYELKGPSTSTMSGTLQDYPGGELLLRFDYDRDGILFRSGLHFFKVRAQRHRAELHCSAEQVRISYDQLVEVQGSGWVNELLDSTPADHRNSWVMNHYMIFFHGSGVYEIVAESWAELPEEQGTWE